MLESVFSVAVIVLKFAYEIFQLWKEKDAEKAKLRKEAIDEGVKVLQESKFENLPEDRRRITSAFARNKRLR